VQIHQRLSLAGRESQGTGLDERHLLPSQSPGIFRRRGLPTDGNELRAFWHLAERGGDPCMQRGQTVQFLDVVQHQQPRSVQRQCQATEATTYEGRYVTQIIGCRQGQSQRLARFQQSGTFSKKVRERGGVGITGIELQPRRLERSRLQVGGDQCRFTDACRPGNPQARHRFHAVDLYEQPIALDGTAKPGPPHLAKRGHLVGACGAHAKDDIEQMRLLWWISAKVRRLTRHDSAASRPDH
jgi:hypothetical protein